MKRTLKVVEIKKRIIDQVAEVIAKKLKSSPVVIYTDGACSNNGKKVFIINNVECKSWCGRLVW